MWSKLWDRNLLLYILCWRQCEWFVPHLLYHLQRIKHAVDLHITILTKSIKKQNLFSSQAVSLFSLFSQKYLWICWHNAAALAMFIVLRSIWDGILSLIVLSIQSWPISAFLTRCDKLGHCKSNIYIYIYHHYCALHKRC